tara:strand:+ start:1257 stop:1748 length:492 start_codon:yes stop_codon:yes gene_type:complete
MIKSTYQLIIFAFLLGCSNFEFVYNNLSDNNKIKDKTLLAISGDSTEIFYTYAINKIKNNEKNNLYKLSIASTKVVEAVVIEKDATASKFNIKLNVDYKLLNTNKNCLILEKNFITNSTYDSKSAGYSFGTDLSEKEVLTQAIHSNFDEFLLYLKSFDDKLNC